MAGHLTTIIGGKPATFDFQLEGGDRVYRLPLMRYLPVKRLRHIASIQKEGGDLVDLMIDMLDEYAPGVTDDITGEQLALIFKAWAAAGDDGHEDQLGE